MLALRWWTRYAGTVGALLCTMAFTGPGGAAEWDVDKVPSFKAGTFSSHEVCGACHKDIHAAWKEKSIHAKTMSNPNYLLALPENEDERAQCLFCHAPTTTLTGDTSLSLAITQEGVTCDFCHSVTAVNPVAWPPYTIDVGDTKRGPLENPGVAPHKVEVSPLHRESRICAGCHEFSNRHGVAVLSNYSEWAESPMAERHIECQGCHMEIYQGQVVFFQDTDEVSRNYINLHAVPGGRSLSQLRRALDIDLVSAKRSNGHVNVSVKVRNRGAGHRVPGGLANRYVLLEVEVEGGPASELQHRTYRRVLETVEGIAISTVPEMFRDAARVRSDSRLLPYEERDERFQFQGRPEGTRVTARLVYIVEPSVDGADRREIEVFRKVGKVK